MVKEAGSIGTKPAPGLHLLTILMQIMRFLPDYRKKHASVRNNSFAKNRFRVVLRQAQEPPGMTPYFLGWCASTAACQVEESMWV